MPVRVMAFFCPTQWQQKESLANLWTFIDSIDKVVKDPLTVAVFFRGMYNASLFQ